MIKIDKLKKKFGSEFQIDITELSFPVDKNIAIIGNNGAGKTSLLELILNLLKTDEGNIFIDGKSNNSFAWKKITSSYLDEQYLIGFYTPKEYMKFCSTFYEQDFGLTMKRLSEFDDFFRFKWFTETKLIRDYSKGNKQKIGILSTLIFDSKIVILDEPFSNLDPSSKLMLSKILRKKRGSTNVVSTHDIDFVSQTFDIVYLMDNGRVIGSYDIENDSKNNNQLYDFFK